jgi:hypothetical protein
MTVVSSVYRERDRGWVQVDDGGMPKGPLRGRLEANPKPRRKHVKGTSEARDERGQFVGRGVSANGSPWIIM